MILARSKLSFTSYSVGIFVLGNEKSLGVEDDGKMQDTRSMLWGMGGSNWGTDLYLEEMQRTQPPG